MKKVSLLIFSIIFSCSKNYNGITPTSEIPARREFPVSPSVNPCDDFYEYTCSEAIKRFKLRDDRSRHTFAFNDSAERILDFKKKYFKELAYKDVSGSKEPQLKNNYVACMDKKSRAAEEKEYVKDIRMQIDNIINIDMMKSLLAENLLKPEFSLFSFYRDNNLTKPKVWDVFFYSSAKYLPERSYYDNDKLVDEYLDLLESFFKTLGYKDAKKRAQSVFAFEKGLAAVYPTPSEFRELYSKDTYESKAKVAKRYPNLGISSFFQKIPGRTEFRNMIDPTLAYLNDKISQDNLYQLQNVYLFFSLNDVLDEAYPDFFNEKFEFQHKFLGGPKTRSDREERCTSLVMSRFSKEIDYILLPKFFPQFDEAKFRKLAENVRLSLLKTIQENKWLTAKARKEAILKMKTAKLKVVKPERIEDWDFSPVADYYPDGFIKNGKIYSSAWINKLIKEFSKPVNIEKWSMGPLTVNAYYNPSYNHFVMPIGILQYPFYDQGMSDIENYAAVGAVIGHELGHGIDDKGSEFDYKGVKRQWMTDQDLKNFEKRGSQLIDQYAKLGHDGKFTLGENIGDLVGVTVGYRTAFPDPKKATPQEKKEFFTSYGRIWCNVSRPKMIEKQLKTDPHALGFARTNEPVKHLAGFYEAFQCQPGDKMYLPPEQRVRIW